MNAGMEGFYYEMAAFARFYALSAPGMLRRNGKMALIWVKMQRS